MDGTALKPFRSKGTAKHRTYRKARTIHVQRREPSIACSHTLKLAVS